MKFRAAIAVVCISAFVMALPASAAPARTDSLSATEQTRTWTGATANGANVTWFPHSLIGGGTCNADPRTYCDETLIKVDVLKTDNKTTLKFRIDGFGKPTDDFDLRVYSSNAAGEPVTYLGSPTGDVAATSPLGADDPRHTGPGDFETKIATGVKPGSYYLVQVVYFSVASSSYKGTVEMSKLPVQPAS